MNWYSGTLIHCIQNVKVEQKLLFVFSMDDTSISSDLLEMLNNLAAFRDQEDVISLLLSVDGSDGFKQFSAIYSVPKTPCLHFILPSGGILAFKTSDFSLEHLETWFAEKLKAFAEWKASTLGAASAAGSLPTPSPASPDNSVTSSSSVLNGSASAADIRERIEKAHQLLKDKRDKDLEAAFEQSNQTEIERRRLGKKMADFKKQQKENSLREELSSRKKDQEESKRAKESVLRQIELDRQDREARLGIQSSFLGSQQPDATFKSTPSHATLSVQDKTEVRLQIRLEEGAHVSSTFSADATLATDVRHFISTEACSDCDNSPLPAATRLAFEQVVRTGYTFRQLRPARRFSTEDELVPLGDLDLWPSAVLVLVCTDRNATVSHNGSSLFVNPQNAFSQLLNLLDSGMRTGTNLILVLGGNLLSIGRSIFAVFTGAWAAGVVGNSANLQPSTVQQSSAHSPSLDQEGTETRAVRRQGKVNRLSHMPDDTDEQARWNGNSTTQL